MKIHLTDKKCVACEGGIDPLSSEQIMPFAAEVPLWKVADDKKSISRLFAFKDFKEAMAFANKVGDIAESEGHHPDIEVGWGKVGVRLTTHAIKGLHDNDFIVAAKIDKILDI